MQDQSERRYTVRVDNRIEAYSDFFADKRVEALTTVALNTPLEQPLLDLWLGWRSVAAAHSLPRQVVLVQAKALLSFAKELSASHGRLLKAAQEKLVSRVGAGLSETSRHEIDSVFDEFEVNREKIQDAPLPSFDVGEQWRAYLEVRDFQLSIRASQQLCFSGLYYAYEDFLVQAYRLAAGESDYRMARMADFEKKFKTTFGDELTAHCLTDKQVVIARLVRNSLAHCGGRPTAELKKEQHAFAVLDGLLQVTAKETRALHDLLLDRVEAFTRATVRSKFSGGK